MRKPHCRTIIQRHFLIIQCLIFNNTFCIHVLQQLKSRRDRQILADLLASGNLGDDDGPIREPYNEYIDLAYVTSLRNKVPE